MATIAALRRPTYEPEPPPSATRPSRGRGRSTRRRPLGGGRLPARSAPRTPDEVRALDEALPVEDPLVDSSPTSSASTSTRARPPRAAHSSPRAGSAPRARRAHRRARRRWSARSRYSTCPTTGARSAVSSRTLGPPWVTARPHEGSTGEVTVVVAWELSWYQFRIDLGDADEPGGRGRQGTRGGRDRRRPQALERDVRPTTVLSSRRASGMIYCGDPARAGR